MASFGFITITLLSLILFYQGSGKDKRVLLLFTLWILFLAVLSASGYFTNTIAKPPRFLIILLGTTFLSFTIYRIVRKNQLNSNLLLFIHTLRLPIEIELYYLYTEKQIPVLMTFKGWNFDIFMGISATIILLFIFLSNKKLSHLFMIIWNSLGLILLLLIVVIAILSSPLPIQLMAFDQPNIAVLHFPYIFLPALIVPIVFLTHILTLKNYLSTNRNSTAQERFKQ